MNKNRPIIKGHVKDAMNAIWNFNDKLNEIWNALSEQGNIELAGMVQNAIESWTNGIKTVERSVEEIATIAYDLADENEKLDERLSGSMNMERIEAVMRFAKNVKNMTDAYAKEILG